MYYHKFALDKKVAQDLSKEEKELLVILEGIVKDASLIYKIQLEKGFYPKGVTVEQLEKAAENDKSIASPYTNVEMKNDQLEAVSYHKYFAEHLEPIAKKIEKAAGICTNKSLKVSLQAQARSLIDGSYEEAYNQWLNVKNSNVDFYIGFLERHLDKAFFIKKTLQAHVGIVDKKYSKLMEDNKETLYSSAKISFSKYHSTGIPKRGVSVFVEHITAIAGYPAYVLTSGQYFPSDFDMALKYGSKTIIYYSIVKFKFNKWYYPIFHKIFEKTFASKYSKDLLFEAALWCIFLYELGKQLHRYNGARKRLQDAFGPLDEANGFVSGIEHSKHLVVKGLLSQDTLEAIMIIHIIWMQTDWLLFKNNIAKHDHIIGSSILFNSYLSHGALREQAGISWPNFSRIFFEIEALSYKFVYLLQEGTYAEAREFIEKMGDLKVLEKLSVNLKKISTKV
ncbi:hypothetical protein HYS95_01135 [Candidatus Daviesbacteria bacterium]|nr:hypothetical protein [Candidatus Daviesbacteria bacterium]